MFSKTKLLHTTFLIKPILYVNFTLEHVKVNKCNFPYLLNKLS